MRLSSIHSGFVFNLPSNFLKPEIIESYTPFLKGIHSQYDNVIDYLNSTIKSITIPGLSIETPTQDRYKNKQISYKPATHIQDIVSTNTSSITFRSVDNHLNYMLMRDIFSKHYLDTQNLYVESFRVVCLDIYRNGIYEIVFKENILTSLSDMLFDYSRVKIADAEFTLEFKFNYHDIEFLLDRHKVLELKYVPTVIQKI